MQRYNNSKIIIGLDHGYGNIKTAHRIFRTGVECFEEEPIVTPQTIDFTVLSRKRLLTKPSTDCVNDTEKSSVK